MLVQHDRVHQQTTKQIVDVPQFQQETSEMVGGTPEVPLSQVMEEVGDESVDVPGPPRGVTSCILRGSYSTCSPIRKCAWLGYIS